MNRSVRLGLETAALALLVSIAIGSILMLVAGKSPGHVWWDMLIDTLGDPYRRGQLVYRATGLMLTGLSVSVALDAGLFNIGGEAQVTAGVLACSVVGTALPVTTPAILAIPACVIAAALAGAAVGASIGALKVVRNAHEVITSIMMNAIVIGLALFAGNHALFRGGTTHGASIAPGAELPHLGSSGSSANLSIVIALACVGLVWWLRERTTWGTAWRAVGADPEAASATGISVGKVRFYAMTGAGALAGLAAANFVMGHKHAFEEGLGRGYGLLGISAALLGRVHPVGVALATLVLGFLAEGGQAVGREVPKELTEMLQGVVVLAIACAAPWVKRAHERSA